MSATPVLDYCRSVALNENLRHEIRLGASALVIRYEKPPPGVVPFVPPLPQAGYSLPPLTSTQACQSALATIAADAVSGKLRLDTAKLLREHVEALLPSLEVSEVREKLAEFAALVESVEASRTIDHVPEAGPRSPDDDG